MFDAKARSTIRGIPEFPDPFVFSIRDPSIELCRGTESPTVSLEALQNDQINLDKIIEM